MVFVFIGFGLACIGFGVVMTLIVQGGMATGRLVQHARNLQEACAETAEYKALAEQLAAKLAAEAEAYETRLGDWETSYAQIAMAYDKEVHRNHTVESRRVEAWKALDGAIRELHADPDPKCITCGDSIKVDDQCFVCGLHDWSTDSERPAAQA